MSASLRAAKSEVWPNSRFGPGAYAMFAFFAISAVITIVVHSELADVVGVVSVFVGSVTAGTLIIRNASALEGRERFGWSMVGAGLITASIAVATVAAIYAVVGDAPAFGASDLIFFSAYGLMMAGFAALPHTQGSPLQRWRMAIDGLIGAVSVGTLLWVYFVSDLLAGFSDLTRLERTIGAMYPFFDLMVFTVALLVLLRRSTYRFDRRVALFTVGVGVQVLGDVLFLASASAGTFGNAEPPFALNLIALSAFYAVGYQLGGPRPTREYADRNPPLWTVVAPYLPAVGMVVVFLFETIRSSGQDVNGMLLSATIVVGLLVIARQGVAIIENRAQIEQQRDTLVSTISHELRTPLTSILGFVELLKEGDESIDPLERRGMLDIVHRQADYMARIVSDLIMLARDKGDELELRIDHVSMAKLAKASIEASGLSEHSVRIECPPDLVGFVDSDRLQQVLVNLLTNAARYGGPRRIVRFEMRGNDLVVEVHDDGPGIPRRYEVRVWDRFERGPNRLNSEVPGSGIGLAIVSAIVSAHGGSVAYCDSEDLGGACFRVSLPGRGSLEGAAPVPDFIPASEVVRGIV